MYKISQLADLLGLSRTTLLYYEKLGLIRGQRLENGYRSYSDKDLQRLRLIQKLQAGGLTLKECQACLEEKIERDMLQKRLNQLDEEIEQKQKSRALLAALLGEAPLTEWHESLDQVAPDAHLEWLKKQGFDDKQALHLKWLSKDINHHEQYMQDFNRVFSELERWGPGSTQDTQLAIERLPNSPASLLEIGCGKGLSTQLFAQRLDCHITALDNEASALQELVTLASEQGFNNRIAPVCASMTALPFCGESFDVIWAEGSAYIMGVENALKTWRQFLKPNGVLVISDLVWSSDERGDLAADFWSKEYPDMSTVSSRIKQASKAGYTLVDSFALSDHAWDNYYLPLKQRVELLRPSMAESVAMADLDKELQAFASRKGDFDYQMFILQLNDEG